MYPKSIEDLINSLQMLPGVGAKSAERYAFEMLEWNKNDLESFAEAIHSIQTNIKKCEICGNVAESERCEVCKNPNRNKAIICIVQSSKDVLAMEKMHEYDGLYHVLNGVISTTKGILPENLNIKSLLARVDENTKEVIIATNPTVEGELTALYISKLLKDKNVEITRIAHGIPMGGHLDYTDELTLMKALEGRKSM